jgi:hypothetical protein
MGWGANGEVSSFGRICSLGGFEGVGLWDRGIVWSLRVQDRKWLSYCLFPFCQRCSHQALVD